MIKSVTENTKLLEILDKYSFVDVNQKDKTSDIIKKLAQNVSCPELIVPVLGSQGMGKSTLINAVLGANILPNDADETTCVPVEIRYGKSDRAIVCFQSGEKTEINLSCDSLREFVDNNENQGNQKCVSHIVLETPCKLLESGLVIVDLPGVGSLTKNNHETTMRYIRQLCTAIFVIPTVPTIRRTEEIFIRGAWSSFSSAVFVQNRWDGESDREVEESVAHNSMILKSISKKANTDFDGKICVVNAYKAILARINNNEDECEESNLPELLAILENISKNRINLEMSNFRSKIFSYIESAQTALSQIIAESQMNEEQLRQEKLRIRENFINATNEIQDVVDDIIRFADEEKEKSERFASELSKTASENLRADIRKIIDSGVVDGEQLTVAFSECQEKYLLDAIEQHYDYMNQFSLELSKKLEVLSEMIQLQRAASFEALKFENGQAFKFEKGLEFGVSLGGAIGGFLAVEAVGEFAAAKLGTLLGSAAGPVGAVIGAVVGIGISIVVGLIGKKSKEGITATRASQAKKEIEPFIEEFGDNLYSSIFENINEIMRKISDSLNEYMTDRRDYLGKLMITEEQSIVEAHKTEYDVSALNEHYAYLESEKETLK